MHFNSVKSLNEHINSIHNHFFLLDSDKPFYTLIDRYCLIEEGVNELPKN